LTFFVTRSGFFREDRLATLEGSVVIKRIFENNQASQALSLKTD